jgi:ferric-dicitrate binding protein FerR (iron transport regulator)
LNTIKTTFAALSLAAVSFAAQPVASVTSGVPFDLRGNRVNVAGVPAWTVLSGDEISTQSGQAVIQLRDGSRVTVFGSSKVQVDSDDQTYSVRLLSGSMQVLSALPGLRVYVQSSLVTPSIGDVVSSAGSPALAKAQGASAVRPAAIVPVSRK